MLQVIRGIFEENEKTHTVATESRPKIILIAANRREEDILFRDELASLQTRFPSHIQVHHTTPHHAIRSSSLSSSSPSSSECSRSGV
jgi:ferredoxin-NADP reductase